MANVLAIDLGASSGRAILGDYSNDVINLKEISRFDDYIISQGKNLSWDMLKITDKIYESMQLAEKNGGFDSIAINTWGVDFGLIDRHGQLIRNPIHYRDPRTKGMTEYAASEVSLDKLYEETGIQIMEINTLFQLLQVKKNEPNIYNKTEKILLMPDLINYILTGKMYAEKSIASTTQLFDPIKMNWNKKLIDKFGLKKSMFPQVISSGKVIDQLKPALQNKLSISNKKVVSAASHDTASAIVSTPTENNNPLFLSNGTWSLLGKELNEPCLNKKAMKYNLANEVGTNDKITFLSNITGLWIIQECKRYYANNGLSFTYSQIAELASRVRNSNSYIDVNDKRFSKPSQMPNTIIEYLKETKQEVPETPEQIFRVVYESLAMKYKEVLKQIEDVVQEDRKSINIIGGGAKARILCQLTANITGKEVIAGPVEATATGNILVQLMALNEIDTIQEGRSIVKRNNEVVKYYPDNDCLWEKKYDRYKQHMIRKEGEE